MHFGLFFNLRKKSLTSFSPYPKFGKMVPITDWKWFIIICYFLVNFRITRKYPILGHGSLALDSAVVWKISKRHFLQDIKNSFHGVTRMGLEPHQNFFQNFFSTIMVVRGVQNFCILEGTTEPLIEQWLRFLGQFSPDMWWTNAKNFKWISWAISWAISKLWSFNWTILGIARLRS